MRHVPRQVRPVEVPEAALVLGVTKRVQEYNVRRVGKQALVLAIAYTQRPVEVPYTPHVGRILDVPEPAMRVVVWRVHNHIHTHGTQNTVRGLCPSVQARLQRA